MAVKISLLPNELVTPDDADVVPVVDAAPTPETKRITIANLRAALVSLQNAYNTARDIVVDAVKGPIAPRNDSDDADLVFLSRDPAAVLAGRLLRGMMGANTIDPAIDVEALGSGPAYRARSGALSVDVTPSGIDARGDTTALTIAGLVPSGVGQAGRAIVIESAPGSAGDGVTPGGAGGSLTLRANEGGADGGAGAGADGSISIGETQTSTTMVGASIGVGLVAPTVSVLGDALGAVINDQIDLTAQRAGADAIVLAATEATGTIAAKIAGVDVVQVSASGVAVTGQLTATQGLIRTVRTVSGAFSVLLTDDVLLVDTSGGAATAALPDIATVPDGKTITVKDVGGAASTNKITLGRFGAETIEGVAGNQSLETDFGALTLLKSGTGWWYLHG